MMTMINEILISFEHKLNREKISIKIEPLPNCTGDYLLMNRVFTNIIGNAIKYMEPNKKGKITIKGKVEDGNIIYIVEDNGIGIPESMYNKVFDLFQRLNPNETEGEGIGSGWVCHSPM